MKFSFRFLLLLTVALFPATPFLSSIEAQEDEVELLLIQEDEEHEEDEHGEEHDEHGEEHEHEEHEHEHEHEEGSHGIRISINGEEFQIDEEEIGEFLLGNSEEMEAWAERHAEAWEQWAERFESKMERWAEETEEQWEQWAQQYAHRWEKWGNKLEAGEIKGQELSELLEHNLEMLGDMPLGELIDDALESSLGELEDAPLDSLDELQEIVASAVEQSLEALEEEFDGGIRGIEIDVLTRKQPARRLRESIEQKRQQLERDADRKLARMIHLLKRKKDLSETEILEIAEKLKNELMEANENELAREERRLEAKMQGLERAAAAEEEEEEEEEAMRRAQHMARRKAERARRIESEVRRKILADREAAQHRRLAAEERAAEENSEMEKLETIYRKLKSEKETLLESQRSESRASAIAEMRREIEELRAEVQRMKAAASKGE